MFFVSARCTPGFGGFLEILEIELNISQKYIDNLLDTITKDLLSKKNIALNSLDEIVQSLCIDIETRLSI